MVTTAYLAALGFEQQLADELALASVAVARRHDRLLITEAPPVASAWAANTWFDAEELEVTSIGSAAKALRARQRNWAAYAPILSGRARLIAERLPHVSAKPLVLGAPAPTAPLGSWTLLRDDLVLAAAHCSSPFPNGEAHFEEDRTGPPSRAYLKLAEALARLGRQPAPGERCLDLGASPGGWTWYLAGLGARVEAVDKAPLANAVMAQPGVRWRAESAFAIDPERHEPVDWMCSDVIAYPERLLGLVERWIASGRTKNIVCTVKFQGPTDHAVAARFVALPGGRLQHLHHNRHELTFTWPDRPATLG